jgi:hypothetical protein
MQENEGNGNDAMRFHCTFIVFLKSASCFPKFLDSDFILPSFLSFLLIFFIFYFLSSCASFFSVLFI